MVRRISEVRWFPILAVGLAGFGCVGPAARRTAPPGQGVAPSPAIRAVAEPAALQIPGPPPGAPLGPVQFVNHVESLPSAGQAPKTADQPATLPMSERLTPVAQAQSRPLPPSSENGLPLGTLYRLAQQRYATTDGYIVRLRRREQVGGKNQPEEILLLKFRKGPWSVYLRWLGKEGGKREVVHVKDRHGGLVHTLTAVGDGPPGGPGAGKHVTAPPDHPSLLACSRYPVTEYGVGPLIDRFGRLVEALERGDTRLGTLKYLGQVTRPEFDAPVEAVMQLVPPGVEPGLAKGGRRFWFFDPSLRFPVLLVAQDEGGGEVEYYCYDSFLFPARFHDDEFDPERLWGK